MAAVQLMHIYSEFICRFKCRFKKKPWAFPIFSVISVNYKATWFLFYLFVHVNIPFVSIRRSLNVIYFLLFSFFASLTFSKMYWLCWLTAKCMWIDLLRKNLAHERHVSKKYLRHWEAKVCWCTWCILMREGSKPPVVKRDWDIYRQLD